MPYDLDAHIEALKKRGYSPEESYATIADDPEAQEALKSKNMTGATRVMDYVEGKYAGGKMAEEATKKNESFLHKFQEQGKGQVADNLMGILGTIGDLSGAADKERARVQQHAKNSKYSEDHGRYGEALVNALKAIPLAGGALESTLDNYQKGDYGKIGGDAVTAILLGGGRKIGGRTAATQGPLIPAKYMAAGKEGLKSAAYNIPLIGKPLKAGIEAAQKELALQNKMGANPAPEASPMQPQSLGPRPSGIEPLSPADMAKWEQMQKEVSSLSPFPQLPRGRGNYQLETQQRLAKANPLLSSGVGEMTPAQKGQWTKVQNKMAEAAIKAAEEEEYQKRYFKGKKKN